MIQENWFYTPIWHEYLQFDSEKIAKLCLDLKQNNHPNRVVSNRGGWQSENLDFERNKKLKPIQNLLEERVKLFSNSIGGNLTFKLDNSWVNINGKGCYNIPHVHPACSFSGTLYIQVPEDSGDIRFYNDFVPIKHYPVNLDKSPNFHTTVTYKPKEKMIIYFPPWIVHEVLESKSEEQRISISFNLRQLNS
jgi:uncharacterized protein (TIGR02466 family)